MSHLPPGSWSVSLLRAARVRQLLDDIADSETAAAGRQVVLLHLQPAEGAHRETLAQTGGGTDTWAARQFHLRGQ